MEFCKEDDELFQFIKKMPKLELHAHLNGSITQATLQKLVDMKKEKINEGFPQDIALRQISLQNISECFEVFDLIEKVTGSPESIYMATMDVIKEFYDDGVKYLELRTTPKEIASIMTQDTYVEAVLKAIEDSAQLHQDLTVKLLLSINRKRPLRNAEETLKIAERVFIQNSTVVGIDLSGDPAKGDVKDFIPIFQYAKKIGLKLAIHISEIPGVHEEIEQLLRLHPDRLGHGTYLHPLNGGSSENFKLVQNLKIPLEICLTSNVKSKTVSSYEEHHFKLFREMNYPCVICTDDKGVFNTTLTNEYLMAAKFFSLSNEDLFDLSYSAIDYTFSDEWKKTELKKLWKVSSE